MGRIAGPKRAHAESVRRSRQATLPGSRNEGRARRRRPERAPLAGAGSRRPSPDWRSSGRLRRSGRGGDRHGDGASSASSARPSAPPRLRRSRRARRAAPAASRRRGALQDPDAERRQNDAAEFTKCRCKIFRAAELRGTSWQSERSGFSCTGPQTTRRGRISPETCEPRFGNGPAQNATTGKEGRGLECEPDGPCTEGTGPAILLFLITRLRQLGLRLEQRRTS